MSTAQPLDSESDEPAESDSPVKAVTPGSGAPSFASQNGQAAVEISGLTKRYRLSWKRRILTAVNSLDLTVQRGEVFGLLGPNGSGKSTTLKILLGLIPATSGSAKLFGNAPASPEARRSVGYLPENPYFYRFLNGDETLQFYGKLCGLSGAALAKRIDELIDLVGLQNGRERPLGSYSKGMLQRIGLAQALIQDPKLLLLDEPTAGVDPIGSREIRDLIVHLKEQGKTVVFCSHLLEQVQQVCDRVAVLNLGSKLFEGPLDEIITLSDRTRIDLAGLDESQHEAVREALARFGAHEIAFSNPSVSLEERFVEMISQDSARPSNLQREISPKLPNKEDAS